jgi:hypothetical protein
MRAEDAMEATGDVVHTVRKLAARFGDPHRYSDGRLIMSHAEIDHGFVTEHVWHPDPVSEPSQSWRGDLFPGDDDGPPPGRIEVSTNPATQTIHTRVMRFA